MSNYGGGGYGGGGYGQQNSNPYGGGGNPYAQQGGNPYDQRQAGGNPYAQQQSNPYDQRQGGGNPYAQQGNQGGRYGAGNDMEMGQMNGGYSDSAPAQDPTTTILNECADVNRGVDAIRKNLDRLKFLQQQSLDDPDASQNTRTNRELDGLSSDTMNMYRNFTQRVKKIKGMPGAGSGQCAPQVGRVERNLKDAIQEYQQVDAEFRKKLQAQMARQYRIVRPDASDAEVAEATEDTSSTQIFSQALLQDRRGQSQSALRAVQGRHEAIQKIERQVVELAQLFEDMNTLVVQQEAQVERIDQQADTVQQDVTNANTQLDGAVTSARAARKKKWICLGIVVAIIIVIAIILAILFGVVKVQGGGK